MTRGSTCTSTAKGIEVLHQPAAHTDGDVLVFFRRSDVVVAGDILDTTRFPVIDVARGGSINGEIAALNRLVDLAIPSVPIVSREAGTLVIPGHGRVCDQTRRRGVPRHGHDRSRSRPGPDQGGHDAGPGQGRGSDARVHARYGADSGPWTTDIFVEAVYQSLAQEKP